MAQWVKMGEGKAEPSDLSMIAWLHQKVVLLSKVPGRGVRTEKRNRQVTEDRVEGLERWHSD